MSNKYKDLNKTVKVEPAVNAISTVEDVTITAPEINVVVEPSMVQLITEVKKYNYRLVVNNPFGKFKVKGRFLLSDEDIQYVIDSGNLRNCCKSSL